LGDGTQKLLYLPEAHTDFIYSVIAEELGIIGCMLVIVLFACVVVQGLRLALRIRIRSAPRSLWPHDTHRIPGDSEHGGGDGPRSNQRLDASADQLRGSSLIATLGCMGILLSLSSTVARTGKMARRRDV